MARRTVEELDYDMTTKTKLCTSCGDRKNFSKFGKHQKTVDGIQSLCKKCQYPKNLEHRKRNLKKQKVRSREHYLQSTYGISQVEYLTMVEEVGGRCSICGKEDKLYVDHDHSTGAIRGLLCHTCNAGLGLFYDDVDNLRSAIKYLLLEEYDEDHKL